MRVFLKKFWPVGFILLLWFVFSAPYFFQHKVPYASKYQVTFFTPWSEYQEFAGPVKNGAMPDVVDQIYPWKHFTIESLKKGQIPFWNPYSFSGTPHLANYQSAVFSPFNLLFFILPFVDAWSLLILLQPLLAGLFMYLFLREQRVSSSAALVGSNAFMFCGFMVTWMAYGTLAMAVAFLPLALLGIEKGFRGRSFVLGPLLLTLSIAISFFSGHFQVSLYFALYTFSYLLFKYFQTKDFRAFLRTGGFYLGGVLIALIQIIPTLELYKVAVRSEIFSNAGAIPWHYLVTVFSPDFYGNPVTRNDWLGYYAEWGSFIGIIPLVLAFAALFVKKNKKIVLFFFFAGLTALLFAVDSPFQKLLVFLKLPVFSTSIPSRIVFLFSFSFAVLAAFGFDFVIEQLKKRSFRKIVIMFSVFSASLLFIWSLLLIFKILPADKSSLAVRNMFLPSLIFSSIFAAVVLNSIFKKKFLILFLGVLLLLFTAFDSLRFANKWMPFDSRELVFPKMPVVEAMQKNVGNGRVYGDFGAYIDTYYNLPSIDGYDPLYNKRYGEFIQSATNGEFVNAQRSIVSLDKRGKYAGRVLDLLGVTIVYHPISRTNQGWAFPVWSNLKKYSVIYQDDKFQLFRNNTALPRAKLFYSYEVLKDDKNIIKKFYNDKFDFRNVLLLEEEPHFAKASPGKPNNKVEITSYTPNRVKIFVSTDKPGLLFLSDSYYPKWKVKVNGKEQKIYRADYAFRAVLVPNGESEVEFYYNGLF